MPICVLKYSSLKYRDGGKQETDEEFKVLEGYRIFNAIQHGIIDRLRQAVEHYKELAHAKIQDISDILQLGKEIADTDIELYSLILKPRKVGRLGQIGKWVLYLITASAIVFLVWIVFHYIFGLWMPFFEMVRI